MMQQKDYRRQHAKTNLGKPLIRSMSLVHEGTKLNSVALFTDSRRLWLHLHNLKI